VDILQWKVHPRIRQGSHRLSSRRARPLPEGEDKRDAPVPRQPEEYRPQDGVEATRRLARSLQPAGMEDEHPRGPLERHGAESAVHRIGASRPRVPLPRRALFGSRSGERRLAARGDPRTREQGQDHPLLHTQHGSSREDLLANTRHRPWTRGDLGLACRHQDALRQEHGGYRIRRDDRFRLPFGNAAQPVPLPPMGGAGARGGREPASPPQDTRRPGLRAQVRSGRPIPAQYFRRARRRGPKRTVRKG
jgi:hypothetical protein